MYHRKKSILDRLVEFVDLSSPGLENIQITALHCIYLFTLGPAVRTRLDTSLCYVFTLILFV
jgi:hypothetical protein